MNENKSSGLARRTNWRSVKMNVSGEITQDYVQRLLLIGPFINTNASLWAMKTLCVVQPVQYHLLYMCLFVDLCVRGGRNDRKVCASP